ncbi:Hsp20/alpha crystallin family protein [Halobaculum sp. WSA2]|uniref:Hsp20/alpha crystallin family protein n=1 Tax=Halobaculum saliterrae TaxID=2073113 RepID=A0A6B0SQV3_9EURY|nr:Hsp20/alpha crystallin family protein [Halobaculum saliterrae]MXR41318.1 Hsp20/alpha crystallin family protein [Halobaculum saliterrae]
MPERDQFAEGADRLKDVGESAMNTVLDRVGRGVATVQEKSPLAYDVLESADAFLVVFDAPGAERSDVQVRFNEGAVEVRIDRFRDFREGFEMRFPGRGLALDGRAELPPGAAVEPEDASSTLTDHGTLRVRVPKAPGGSVAVEESDADANADDEPVQLDMEEDADAGDDDADDADAGADDPADGDGDDADADEE